MNPADSSAQHAYMIGGYEITATAGAGGMGVVYRAIDTALGRTVAIKVLKDELQAHPAVVARFRREAEAIATLNHPNIVRVYAVGDSDGLPYIAMEYVEGRPLSDILVESGSLPWEEALDIGLQVANALASAHERQIVHRDIKPANILVQDDGNIKVTDFGIAKILNASTQLTVDGTRIGTPQYMCPERCRNLPVTPKSDIYSLGVMLFQCVTGRLPFEAASSSELIAKISGEVPKRIRDFKPDTPESVDRLIAYMLEKDAENRPPDSQTLRTAMERVRRGESIADELPAFDDAMVALRQETPPPRTTSSTTASEAASLTQRLRRYWFKLRPVNRILVAGMIVLTCLALSLGLLQRWMPTPIDLSAHNAVQQETERWTARSQLAHFRPETDAITTGFLTIDDMHIDRLFWVDGADGAVVGLHGGNNTPRARQRALFTVDPYLPRASVLVPPKLGVPFTILNAGSQGGAAPGVVLSTTVATHFLSSRPGSPPDTLAPWPSVAATRLSPDGTVVLARKSGDGSSRLVWLKMDSPEQSVQELDVEGEIMQIATDGEFRHISILSEVGDSKRLSMAAMSHPAESLEVVADEIQAVSDRPFSRTGGNLAFVADEGTAGNRAIVQSVYNRHETQDMGSARSITWRPETDELLIVAPDHAQRDQLWIGKPGGEPPLQLSFIESGLSPEIAVSEDGRYVVAFVPNSGQFLVVELPAFEANTFGSVEAAGS